MVLSKPMMVSPCQLCPQWQNSCVSCSGDYRQRSVCVFSCFCSFSISGLELWVTLVSVRGYQLLLNPREKCQAWKPILLNNSNPHSNEQRVTPKVSGSAYGDLQQACFICHTITEAMQNIHFSCHRNEYVPTYDAVSRFPLIDQWLLLMQNPSCFTAYFSNSPKVKLKDLNRPRYLAHDWQLHRPISTTQALSPNDVNSAGDYSELECLF